MNIKTFRNEEFSKNLYNTELYFLLGSLVEAHFAELSLAAEQFADNNKERTLALKMIIGGHDTLHRDDKVYSYATDLMIATQEGMIEYFTTNRKWQASRVFAALSLLQLQGLVTTVQHKGHTLYRVTKAGMEKHSRNM